MLLSGLNKKIIKGQPRSQDASLIPWWHTHTLNTHMETECPAITGGNVHALDTMALQKKKSSQVTSGMIYWGVKTCCSLLSVCCRFLLQPGPVCKRASLMSKSLLWGRRQSGNSRNSSRFLCCRQPKSQGAPAGRHLGWPAAVWRYARSNDRGLIMTQSCRGRARMLFCLQTTHREFTGQIRVAPGTFRGCRCLLPREPAMRLSL